MVSRLDTYHGLVTELDPKTFVLSCKIPLTQLSKKKNQVPGGSALFSLRPGKVRNLGPSFSYLFHSWDSYVATFWCIEIFPSGGKREDSWNSQESYKIHESPAQGCMSNEQLPGKRGLSCGAEDSGMEFLRVILYPGAVFWVMKLPKLPIFLWVTPINSTVHQSRVGPKGYLGQSLMPHVE